VTQAARSDTVFALSALTGEGLPRLLDAVSAAFEEAKTERELLLPFTDGRKRAWLHAEGVVTAESETDDGHRITVRWTARQEKRFREL
jgi:GTP-binding protein HflX